MTKEMSLQYHKAAIDVGLLGQIVVFNYNYPSVTQRFIHLHGWFYSPDREFNGITIYQNSGLVNCSRLDIERTDVWQHLRSQNVMVSELTKIYGFSICLDRLDFDETLDLEVYCTSKGALYDLPACSFNCGLLGTTLSKEQSLWQSLRKLFGFAGNIYNNELNPILVATNGRSGSSLLLDILNNHHNIIVPGSFPYECRIASYLVKSYYLTTTTSNYHCSSTPDDIEINRWFIGSNPFNKSVIIEHNFKLYQYKWLLNQLPQMAEKSTLALIRSYIQSEAVASKKRRPVFYAEKINPCSLINVFRALYKDAKIINLIRNPIDTYISGKAFDRRRSTVSGYKNIMTPEETVSEWCDARLPGFMYQIYLSTLPNNVSITIKYEELAANPVQEVERVFNFLELKSLDDASIVGQSDRINNESAVRAVHRNTKFPHESHTFNDDAVIIRKAFSSFIEHFNY